MIIRSYLHLFSMYIIIYKLSVKKYLNVLVYIVIYILIYIDICRTTTGKIYFILYISAKRFWLCGRRHARIHVYTLLVYITHYILCISVDHFQGKNERQSFVSYNNMYTVVHTRANAIQLLQVRYESKSILPILRPSTAALTYIRIRPRSFPGSSSPPTSRHRPRRAASASWAWSVRSTPGEPTPGCTSSSASAWPRGWTRWCDWPAGKHTPRGSRTRHNPAAPGSNRWTRHPWSPRTLNTSDRSSSFSLSSVALPIRRPTVYSAASSVLAYSSRLMNNN